MNGAPCAQSFALWQQAAIEFTRRDHSRRHRYHVQSTVQVTHHDHSIIACSRHIYRVFFAHISFVVNRAFSATPAERLQRHPLFFTTNRTDPTFFLWRHDLHILVTATFCCDWKARAACAQNFTLWQQAIIEFTRRDHSIIACSHHIYGVVLHAHSVRGEPRIQRNARGEVATRSFNRQSFSLLPVSLMDGGSVHGWGRCTL